MKTNAERRAEIGVERRRKTLARILGAVIQVLEDKPFKDASIEDFIASADVSRGTFYNYFENKAEVALAVATILNQMVEDSIASLEGNTDTLERFATGLVMYLKFADLAPNVAEVMFHEYLSRYPQHPTFVDSSARRYNTTVQDGLEKGVFEVSDLDVAQDVVSGALAFLVSRVSSSPKRHRRDLIVEGVTHLLMALGVNKAQAYRTAMKSSLVNVHFDEQKILFACQRVAADMVRVVIS